MGIPTLVQTIRSFRPSGVANCLVPRGSATSTRPAVMAESRDFAAFVAMARELLRLTQKTRGEPWLVTLPLDHL